jgi:uroporphyrinogen decarboxylase
MPSLTSTARALTALRRGVPDRVPTWEWEIDEAVIQALLPGATQFDFVEWAEHDAIVVFPDEHKRYLSSSVYVDEWGVTKAKTAEVYPIAIDAPIKEPADLAQLRVPDPCSEWHFSTLAEAVVRFKGKKAIIFQSRDAFSIPRYLRGVENMMTDFIWQPELLRTLVEIGVAYNSALAKRAIELGADAIFMSDDYADNRGPMMSPRHYRTFLAPGLRQVVAAIHAAGAPAIKHSDGNIRPIIEDIVSSGIDCLDPLDPLGGMDLGEIKQRYGGRVCLKGNVNIGGALSLGTPDEVRAETLACLQAGMPGGGYVLSTSNSVMACIQPDNYVAMLETLRRYGTYPESAGEG